MISSATNSSSADPTSGPDCNPSRAVEGGSDNHAVKQESSKRHNTTSPPRLADIDAIATAGGGSSACSSSIGSTTNIVDGASMVSLTIPMFRPLNEYKGAVGSSSDETPIESWVGYKVMTKRYEYSDEWTLCEITRVAFDEQTRLHGGVESDG